VARSPFEEGHDRGPVCLQEVAGGEVLGGPFERRDVQRVCQPIDEEHALLGGSCGREMLEVVLKFVAVTVEIPVLPTAVILLGRGGPPAGWAGRGCVWRFTPPSHRELLRASRADHERTAHPDHITYSAIERPGSIVEQLVIEHPRGIALIETHELMRTELRRPLDTRVIPRNRNPFLLILDPVPALRYRISSSLRRYLICGQVHSHHSKIGITHHGG